MRCNIRCIVNVAAIKKCGSICALALCLEVFAFAALGAPVAANNETDALYGMASREMCKGLAGNHKALEHLNKALAIDPRSAKGWCLKAHILGTMEESELALPCIEKALKLEPKNFVLWMEKAEIYCQLGKYDQALTCADTAIQLKNLPDCHVVKAKMLRCLGKLQAAQHELDSLVALDPKNVTFRSERAKLGRFTKNWPQVIEDLSILIEGNSPAAIVARNGAGAAVKNAKVANNAVVSTPPAFAPKGQTAPGIGRYQNLMERAQAYTELKQWDKAIADYKTGLKEHPDMRQYHVGLLKVYTLKGDKKAAGEEQAVIDSFDDDFKPGKWSHD